MKFTLDAVLFVNAFRKMKGAVLKRPTMPILGSVMIEAHGDSVTFRATDLEIGVETTERGVLVKAEGSVVLPLEKALKLLRKLKGSVSLESAKDDTIVIQCPERRSRTTLAGSPVADFPTAPSAPEEQSEIDAGAFGAAITAVLHAASKDETRYNLNGVYIDAGTKSAVRMVTTDGHRLAVASPGSMKLPWKGGIIVPLKGAKYLTDFLKGEDTVTIAHEKGSIQVSGDSWAVSIRLIEGDYPNYKQVIPKNIGETLTADSKEFSEALATVNEMAAERSKAVKWVLDGGLEFHTSNPDLGDSVVECPCERSGTEALSLALNGRYLAEAITAVCEGQVVIRFAADMPESSPIRISGRGEFPFCVVMPLRV